MRGDGKHQPATKHAAQATTHSSVDNDNLFGSLISNLLKRDNGYDHRAGTEIIASICTRKPGFARIVLLSAVLGRVRNSCKSFNGEVKLPNVIIIVWVLFHQRKDGNK